MAAQSGADAAKIVDACGCGQPAPRPEGEACAAVQLQLPSLHVGRARPITLLLTGVMALSLATVPASGATPARGRSFTSTAVRPAHGTRVSGRAAAAATAASSRATATSRAALARPATARHGAAGSTATRAAGSRRPLVSAGPGLLSTRSFNGITQDDTGGAEPPDEWVGVSASYIVHTTNGIVRISSRAGQELASIATWSLFVVPAGYSDSDPRIIWDAYHGRWVGVLVYYDAPTF